MERGGGGVGVGVSTHISSVTRCSNSISINLSVEGVWVKSVHALIFHATEVGSFSYKFFLKTPFFIVIF